MALYGHIRGVRRDETVCVTLWRPAGFPVDWKGGHAAISYMPFMCQALRQELSMLSHLILIRTL